MTKQACVVVVVIIVSAVSSAWSVWPENIIESSHCTIITAFQKILINGSFWFQF